MVSPPAGTGSRSVPESGRPPVGLSHVLGPGVNRAPAGSASRRSQAPVGLERALAAGRPLPPPSRRWRSGLSSATAAGSGSARARRRVAAIAGAGAGARLTSALPLLRGRGRRERSARAIGSRTNTLRRPTRVRPLPRRTGNSTRRCARCRSSPCGRRPGRMPPTSRYHDHGQRCGRAQHDRQPDQSVAENPHVMLLLRVSAGSP